MARKVVLVTVIKCKYPTALTTLKAIHKLLANELTRYADDSDFDLDAYAEMETADEAVKAAIENIE